MVKRLRLKVQDEWYAVEVGDTYQSPVEVVVDGESFLIELAGTDDAAAPSPRKAAPKAEAPGLRGLTQGDERVIRCPLPGKIVAVSVNKGQQIEAGEEICLLESMKMEQSVRMAKAGVVRNIKVKTGQAVNAGQPLIEIQ